MANMYRVTQEFTPAVDGTVVSSKVVQYTINDKPSELYVSKKYKLDLSNIDLYQVNQLLISSVLMTESLNDEYDQEADREPKDVTYSYYLSIYNQSPSKFIVEIIAASSYDGAVEFIKNKCETENLPLDKFTCIEVDNLHYYSKLMTNNFMVFNISIVKLNKPVISSNPIDSKDSYDITVDRTIVYKEPEQQPQPEEAPQEEEKPVEIEEVSQEEPNETVEDDANESEPQEKE